MLEIKDLTILVNEKEIIKDLSFVMNNNDKIAIIGEEGNGKSTLIMSILGIASYANISGIIDTKNNTIGYLSQFINKINLEKSVYNYLFKDENDYYNKINDLYKYLKELNLSEDIIEKEKLYYLSGGEKVKLQLLKLLLDQVDILILDEPTNDLDIDTIKWLENFILKTNKPLLYVSHDETLLSNTANAILHLELTKKKQVPKWTFKRMNYDTYVSERINYLDHTTMKANNERANFKKQQEKLNQIMNKVEHQQNTISRSDPHGAKMLKRKMKSIKSQERRMNGSELTEIPDYEESINFFFEDACIPSKRKILELVDYDLIVGMKKLSKNINLNVVGNQHIVIIGKNGCGKTSLLNIIYNQIKDKSNLKVGYMPQNYDTMLENFNSALDFLCKDGDKDVISKTRSFLGNMNFTSEEMLCSIEELSGGSKAKLILLKLVIDNCNVLILDEPTRNVSPLSNPIIRKTLKEFNGPIISVSHDRKFISHVCDKVYELKPEGLFDVTNDYEDNYNKKRL